MIIRLILVPLGLCLGAATAFCVLPVAALASPDLTLLLGATMDRVLELLANAAAGNDAAAETLALFALSVWKLLALVTCVPVLVVAVFTEIFGSRGWPLQAAGCGVLTAALPFAALPRTLAASGLPAPALAGLFVTGALAGSVYWLVGGRSAGRNRPLSGPSPAGS